jgi:hypothetical protein
MMFSNARATRGPCAWLLPLLACGGGSATDISAHTGEPRPSGDAVVAREIARGAAPTSAPEAAPTSAPRRADPAAPSALALRPITAQQVCASLGAPRPSPHGPFLIDDPQLRATLAGSQGQGIELSFRYLGPTALSQKLRSGRERRQLGLELAARDTCNLLYVMWRIEPSPELVVSVKQNGAQRTHAECENRGYRRLHPTVAAPLPQLAPGAEHQLGAEIVNGKLTVNVDGVVVWRGALDAAVLELRGKSGLRSDNARFEVLGLKTDVLGTPRVCGAERHDRGATRGAPARVAVDRILNQ